MNKHSITLILSVILLIQPLIVVSSFTTFDSATANLEDHGIIEAQDVGTRLTPEEHTNHVPILINGTADFDLQGWPGAGTKGEPYLIAGLNITYDFADPLIWIVNTDAYFIIEDCYINQISTEIAIRINNTAHAKVMHTTVVSPDTSGGGIFFDYAENTVIDHVNVTSGNKMAIKMEYSAFSNITNNFLHSVLFRAFSFEYCDYALVTGNTMRIDNTGNHALFGIYSEHAIIADSMISGGWHSIYMHNCNDTTVEGIDIETDDRGLHIQSSFDVKVQDIEIYAVGDYGAEFWLCEGIEIDGISVSAPNDMGIHLQECNNSLLTNAYVNDTFFSGINVYRCFNSNITNSVATYTGGQPLYIQDSDNCIIDSNMLSESPEEGLYLDSCEWTTISNNEISHIDNVGVYIDSSSHNGVIELSNINATGTASLEIEGDNWTIQDNTIIGVIAIYLDKPSNIDLFRNDIPFTGDEGILAYYSDDCKIINNTLGVITDRGIVLDRSQRCHMEGNLVKQSYRGIVLDMSLDATVIGNTVLNNEYMGIQISYSDRLQLNNNTITNSGYLGLFVTHTENATFKHNIMTNSGILFETIQSLAELNHTLIGNMANGLPVYYAFDESSLTIDGSQYGQIILVNCTGVSVSGGYFNNVSSALQVRYCIDVDVTDFEMIDIRCGNIIGDTAELTISDTQIEGYSRFRAFMIQWSENITFSNVNLTSIESTSPSNGYGISLENSISINVINSNFFGIGYAYHHKTGSNFSIIDCTFENIANYGVYTTSVPYGLVQDCTFVNATYGIRNGGSHHHTYTGNDIRYSNTAIHATGGISA
ncbi:MAG: right-handed parallel beta-helix repeat-containing protein, partial [Candidatus Thorarchaeota archaeon]|nr:right-handed parallel beta-helix repeat-containing protein [Candidatus Thorarchaeota archaeon]